MFKSSSLKSMVAGMIFTAGAAYGILPAGLAPMLLGPAPKPADVSSLDSQLKRFRGQTQFLNPTERRAILEAAPDARARSASPKGGTPRAQQESDIFKVGKQGSKLLFLLNNYRGLQVVSFASGINSPKILGRVAPTGNWPTDMYYDSDNDRLIVLENLWYDASSDTYTYDQVQSRVLVYDVSNPADPKISQKINVNGEISDSRMVGSVLYLATALRSYQSQTPKGMVYSLSLAKEGVSIVQEQDLNLPVSYGQNMNIVEVENNGNYNYYLVAVLSQSGWGWWDRQSQVEVVDISDPAGKISPVMVVSAKGFIEKRSQTTIKNNTLVVVSNYRPGADVDPGTHNPERVAVETFQFPNQKSEVISEDEALFRKLNIERQIQNKTGSDREQLLAKLVADPALGVQGRFVKAADGSLRKLVADSVATVGDTTGLNAMLQDVRYDGNLMYVFWVPQNNRDPFELFDMSAPENGVKRLGHTLYFDGWVAKAFPLTYQNRHFVLGLGWVMPADSEEQRVYPQAVLFEVKQNGTVPQQTVLSQLTLQSADYWAYLNGADKEFEIRQTSDGSGEVMFQVYAWQNGTSVSGGKFVEFDLAKAASGDTDHALGEGGLLAADSGWLRRIFTNPEISRINTFTDESLGTFNANGGRAGGITTAANVLELARNITAYVVLPAKPADRGIQIVSNYSYSGSSSTELRVVGADNADAEKPEVLSSTTQAGYFESQFADARSGTLWVISSDMKYLKKPDGSYEYQNWQVLGHYGLDANSKLVPLSLVRYQEDSKTPYWSYSTTLVQLSDGGIYGVSGTSLFKIADGANPVQVATAGCPSGDNVRRNIVFLSGAPYLYSEEDVSDPQRKEMTYTRNSVAPITVSSSGAACGAAINIPGRPVAILSGNRMITEDYKLVDRVQHTYKPGDGQPDYVYYDTIASWALESLTLASSSATLVDGVDMGKDFSSFWSQQPRLKGLGADRYGYLKVEANAGYPGPWRRGYRGYGGYGYNQNETELVSLGLDSNGEFIADTYLLSDAGQGDTRLLGVYADPVQGGYIGLMANGRKIQAYRWNDSATRPMLQQIQPVDTKNQREPAQDSVITGTWYYSESSPVFDPQTRSFVLPMGEFGVQQFYLP